jgi:hypothetical protein
MNIFHQIDQYIGSTPIIKKLVKFFENRILINASVQAYCMYSPYELCGFGEYLEPPQKCYSGCVCLPGQTTGRTLDGFLIRYTYSLYGSNCGAYSCVTCALLGSLPCSCLRL